MKKTLLLLTTLLLASCSQSQVDTASDDTSIKQVEVTTQKTYTNVVYCDYQYYIRKGDNGTDYKQYIYYKYCDDCLPITDYTKDKRKVESISSVEMEPFIVEEENPTRNRTIYCHYHLYVCYEN